jgi:sodium/pantothenate symporter
VAVSARGRVSRDERLYRLRLHRTPLSEIDRGRTIRTLLAPLGLLVYGCAMPWWLLHYYVAPYQVGTGEILADGSVNWATPEARITLTAFFLHVPLALLAMRVIRRRYSPDAPGNRDRLRRARGSQTSRRVLD